MEKEVRRQLLILAVMKRLKFKRELCEKMTNEELSDALKKDTQGYF